MTGTAPRDVPAPVAALILLLAPLLWLWPAIVGGHTFVPYDLAAFPPAATQLTPEQLAAATAGATFDATEVPVWTVPEARLVRHWLCEHGELATWNPHARHGASIAGHGALGLFYPPNWLLLIDVETLLPWLCWCSLLLAGAGTFLLLRAHRLSRGAALFGALTFQLATPMACNAYYWMRLSSLCWLPLVLWLQTLLASRQGRPRWRPFAGFALAFAMPWLCGFPPYATAIALLAVVHGGVLTALAWRAHGTAAAWRLGRELTLAALVGTALAAPQALPSLAYYGQAFRTADPDLATIAGARFDAFGLLGYLLPDAFGHPTAQELPYAQSPLPLAWCTLVDREGRPAPTNYNYTEYAVFAGTLALVLAMLGAVRPLGRARWLPPGLLLLLLGLATFVPGLRMAFLLPIVKAVWPIRWLAPATLLLAWLAAMGCERLLADARSRASVAVVAAVLAFAALLAWLLAPQWLSPTRLVEQLVAHYGLSAEEVRRHVDGDGGVDRFALAGTRFGAALLRAAITLALVAGALAVAWRTRLGAGALLAGAIALQVGELAWQGAALTAGRPFVATPHTTVHDFLAAQGQASAAQGGFMVARASPTPTLPAQLPPGMLMVPGVRDLHFDNHYDARSHVPIVRLFDAIPGLGANAGQQLAGKGYLTQSLPDHPVLAHPLFDLFGVRYLLSSHALQHAGTRVGPRLQGPGGEFFVYERATALPRAFAVDELRVLPDDDAVLAAMIAPGFAPRRDVLVTAAEAVAPRPEPFVAGADGRDVTFTRQTPANLELTVADGPAGWLVLTDGFLPGWSATVDERTVDITRVDHCLRAVPLPAGRCTVRMGYQVPGLRLGLVVAALALLALLALLVPVAGRRTTVAVGDTPAAP